MSGYIRGVPEDLIQAYMFFTVGLAYNAYVADNRSELDSWLLDAPEEQVILEELLRKGLEEVSALLTPEQLTEAKELVFEWIKAYPHPVSLDLPDNIS